MKYLSLVTSIVFTLLTVCKPAHAQEKTDSAFTTLLCKEWKLDFYVDNGEKLPPTPEQKGDRMFFYRNNTVKSIEGGEIQHATWKYDETRKIVTVIDNETKAKFIMKVVSLTNEVCVIDVRDPEGSVMRMQMSPVKAK